MFGPKSIGKAWTAWVQPIIGISACRSVRRPRASATADTSRSVTSSLEVCGL
ncbi:hypothetical protein HSRCO_0077 [Halanaeroarchaeum sp. HSR-CO]|nr:hypothetical protein HSRCO_0077 [Halanaeroarchaeum sp. HSR-CO]